MIVPLNTTFSDFRFIKYIKEIKKHNLRHRILYKSVYYFVADVCYSDLHNTHLRKVLRI